MQVPGAVTGNVIAYPPHFSHANGGQHVLFEVPDALAASRRWIPVVRQNAIAKLFRLKSSTFATLLMQTEGQKVRLQPGAGCKSDAPRSSG